MKDYQILCVTLQWASNTVKSFVEINEIELMSEMFQILKI